MIGFSELINAPSKIANTEIKPLAVSISQIVMNCMNQCKVPYLVTLWVTILFNPVGRDIWIGKNITTGVPLSIHIPIFAANVGPAYCHNIVRIKTVELIGLYYVIKNKQVSCTRTTVIIELVSKLFG